MFEKPNRSTFTFTFTTLSLSNVRFLRTQWHKYVGDGELLYLACHFRSPCLPFSLVDPSIHLLGQEGGASPLYMASEGGHVDTVAALLDLGADVHKAQVRVHVLVRRLKAAPCGTIYLCAACATSLCVRTRGGPPCTWRAMTVTWRWSACC